jgi:TPR repeat protein
MGNSGRRIRISFNLLFAGLIVWSVFGPSPASAQTRRAFLVGVQHYSDKKVPALERTINDANDLAKDLEELGFDKKNIKVANDIKTKDAFDREFNTFLKTVESGDTVVFYFSGHGFGIEENKTNYLLLADLKSPFTYARSQMPEKDRKNDDVVRLRIPSYLDSYQQNEIPKSGFSATEIELRLADKNPKSVIMILDACRSLMTSDPNTANKDSTTPLKRGNDSGSRLVTDHVPPPGFVIMYSASFGEQALEKLPGTDSGRNSLFTSVLRSELQRPGQSLTELGERVKLMVRVIANKAGRQQEPDFVAKSVDSDSFSFVGSIGRERFQMSQDKCEGSVEDWEQIKDLAKRELFERHRRRFDFCKTGQFARRALIQLQLTSDDTIEPPVSAVVRAINECDQRAAAELDSARPPEVPGVNFNKIDADLAILACKKAIADNPRIARYFFNLGRAYQKRVAQPGISPAELAAALREARLNYDEAAKRGYVSALNNLAVLYEYAIETENLAVLAEAGGAIAFQREATQKETAQKEAVDLLKRAAQQGHPLAMYNLALHYRDGSGGLRRDIYQAAELQARSAESGFLSAMVEHGVDLYYGRGVPRKSPRRGVEWLQRAADAGSARAKLLLGIFYGYGSITYDKDNQEDTANSVRADPGLALLWMARVAEAGDSGGQALLANLMEDGTGLANRQPEIAERYWRMAAHGGNSYAQAEFADRLRRGLILVKQEYGEQEAINLLQHAMSQGSPKATLALAQINRTGEFGRRPDPLEAMRLAYRTIELAVQTDPTSEEGNPFHEIAAAHLLVEMAKNGEAVDAAGRLLLNESEIGRIERYYGSADPVNKQVKVRRLLVPLGCGFVKASGYRWTVRKFLWVWDWGRSESPTESQFRNLERTTGCINNDLLRKTLIDVFEQSKKSNVAFADLIDQKIKTAVASRREEPESKRSRRRR